MISRKKPEPADTVAVHPHDFPKSDWPFSDPINVVVIVSAQAKGGKQPILLVTHDYDGDWQALCDTPSEVHEGLVACLGCVYQQDRTLGELADLPRGWRAWRDHVGAVWQREQKDPEDDDE